MRSTHMHPKPRAVAAALLLTYALSADADVLYKNAKAIALGKGKLENNIIHWTYCDGKTDNFKKPPHTFVTGEHCNIQPEAFGIKRENGKYFVENEEVFDNFFPSAVKGDQV